ncbi:MAG: hypothetical protein ACLVKR_06185 [Lachnospiraceae bacterium]
MARRVTPQEIVEMNRLYAELGTMPPSAERSGGRLNGCAVCEVRGNQIVKHTFKEVVTGQIMKKRYLIILLIILVVIAVLIVWAIFLKQDMLQTNTRYKNKIAGLSKKRKKHFNSGYEGLR